MQDKEQVYNEFIAPLAERIYALAMEHGIPVQIAAQVSDDSICGAVWIPPESAQVMHVSHAILQGSMQIVDVAPVAPAGRGLQA